MNLANRSQPTRSYACDSKPPKFLFTSALLLAAASIGLFSTLPVSYSVALLVLSLLVVLLGLLASTSQWASLPLLLRPPLTLALASGLGALAGLTLDASDLKDFFMLRCVEFAGLTTGVIAYQRHRRGRLNYTLNQKAIPIALARWTWYAAICASVLFFVWQGIPAFRANVESARVDAAVTGTGYLRLLAYMSVPSALILHFSDERRGWRYVFGAALVIATLANRSPLVYLVLPLLFTFVICFGKRRRSLYLAAGGILLAVLVIAMGTYRVGTQAEFRDYGEYRLDLAQGDYLSVATTTVANYVQIVPENAVLTKRLVDRGQLDLHWGASYLTPMITALPGEQLSLDRKIKHATGRNFIGGGTPPTLAGEGYVNFLWIGTYAVPLVLVTFLCRLADGIPSRTANLRSEVGRLTSLRYSYLLVLASGSQVAGLAGASTFPATSACFILLLTWLRLHSKRVRSQRTEGETEGESRLPRGARP